MKTSIVTVSISGSLSEKLEAIAAADFDEIEIFEQDFIAHDGPPREVGQQIRSMGFRYRSSNTFGISRACPRRCAPRPSTGRSASST